MAYTGLRKPRNDDPEKWAIYNARVASGVKELRPRNTAVQQPALSGVTEEVVVAVNSPEVPDGTFPNTYVRRS